ncbi:hypothetical protein Agub_g7160, partial [Astrephomene gubernaculifera]
MGNGLCSGNNSSSDHESSIRSPDASAPQPGRPDRDSQAGTAPAVPSVESRNPPAPARQADQPAQAQEEAGGGPGASTSTGAAPAATAAAASASPSVLHQEESRRPLMASTAAHKKAAEELKAAGNVLFGKGKYAAAIEKYTEAITLCPDLAVLFVNRGMAARKRGDWARVEADAASALGQGPGERDAMKAHYLMGLALGARGAHEGSMKHLRKALDAAREANDSIKDEIWRELATANYQHWQSESAARREQHALLRRQLAELLLRTGGTTTPTPAASEAPRGAPEPPLPPDWAELFRAAACQDQPREAPSQFTCPLTMEIFRDPVVTPSGRSYERSALLEHLKKVGRFDPITRQPLCEEQCAPNVSLRAAIEGYLEEHPWAWGE